MWDVRTTDVFDGWFTDLDEDSQVEVIAKVNLLKVLGPQLARPHADTLKGARHANLKELRADTARQVLRIAFAFDPERTAILLLGGNKAGVNQKRFYRQLIEQADELFDRHLAELKAKRKAKEH
ncbi:MAG: type II toxin-antitoxin system RelE/ParE family toxin [Planctomycetes bacterium]|nr:type II toxin-antitoxin system RelE/ParE family toxin [Planctomycetota bacterium]